MVRTCVHLSFVLLAGALTGWAGDLSLQATQTATPVTEDSWRFALSMPGWIPWQTGTMGLHGHTAQVALDPGDIIPRWDMVADVRLEAQSDRFGVIAEFLYFSLSDGISSNGVVKKVDVQVDQAMADLALAWRIVATPRARLDLTAGVRYMNFYQRAAFQPNDEQIGDLAGKLAIGSSAVRLASALSVLEGQDPSVPIAPLAAADRSRTARAIARVKGSKAEKQKAIADVLHATLSQTVARVDDWWDPYVGFRAHVDLSEKFYLAAKGDIGGFGVGSQLSWTAEGGLGTHLTNRVYSEIGYRAMGVDYRQDGLVMDTITHGILLNLGVTF